MGCGTNDSKPALSEVDAGAEAGDGSVVCGGNEELFQGRCVDPARRYEPEQPVDIDNVVSFGSHDTDLLDLPAPPKSGFRLVLPERVLAPGEERTECVAWPYPKLKSRHVYSVVLHVTSGLHHANLLGVSYSDEGPSPYPSCATNQGELSQHVVSAVSGDIPDVVFANSTAIRGSEALTFAPGMAFELTTEGREVASEVHWLNASAQTVRAQAVYDVFTMPAGDVVEELVPYYFDNLAFEVPPKSKGDIVTECALYGGNFVTMMPHTHKRAAAVRADLVHADGTTTNVLDKGAFDVETDIEVFDSPISLAGMKSIRYTCSVVNDLTEPIVYGIGDNEMCTLFGYMYPPQSQTIGIQTTTAGCIAGHLGQHRQ